jgi:hypothetical protein
MYELHTDLHGGLFVRPSRRLRRKMHRAEGRKMQRIGRSL